MNDNSVIRNTARTDGMNRKIHRWWKNDGIGYAFLFPFALLFFVFVLLPIIIAFISSFTSYNMIQPAKGIWFTNYRNLFLKDEVFFLAIRNTLIFALVTGPIGYLASFIFAWVISKMKFRNAFSLAFYAPSITSGVAMTIVWGYIFSSDRYGLINNTLINLGIINSEILWNINPDTILPVIMFISIWMSMGTGFLVFLAGIQNVPEEQFEAARIDGVKSAFQELWYVTIPAMKPQMLFGAINSIVVSFAVFDIAVAFAGMPSPNYAAHTIVAHLYDYAFIRFQMGYASTIAIVLFVMTFVLGQISRRIFASND